MERILHLGKPKDPEQDFGAGWGYRIEVFLVEDFGPINKIVPKRLREQRVSVSGGAMSLAAARSHLSEVAEDWKGIEPDIEGYYEARIVKEIPPDDPNRF